jgi:hypothetical protein
MMKQQIKDLISFPEWTLLKNHMTTTSKLALQAKLRANPLLV